MAAPVVSEKAIANLLKDFTRAALRAQPENLVLFGRRCALSLFTP